MLSIQNTIDLQSLDTVSTSADPLGLSPPKIDNRKRFLRFLISQKKEALLSLDAVTEVMQLSREDILSIPDMPGCILGVCSWQGETLWLVDLNHLIGYQSLYQQNHWIKKLSAIVVQHNGRMLGLVVEQVIDIDLLDENAVHRDPGLCSPELEPFVLGHFLQPDSILLDLSAIVDAPQLHAHGES